MNGHRWMRTLVRLVVALVLLLGILVVLLREAVLPAVAHYRSEIEQFISTDLGVPVSIARLEFEWRGVRPRLRIEGLALLDARGETVLWLESVDATLAWSSLGAASPVFHRLRIEAPDLQVRRTGTGEWLVAGVSTGAAEPSPAQQHTFLRWLSLHRQVELQGARLRWVDDWRNAPELLLHDIRLRWVNDDGMARFALQAQTPDALAERLELRGELALGDMLQGFDLDGRLYLELDGANLGAWQLWVDYPVPLQGWGGVRAWLDLDAGLPVDLALKFVLQDVLTQFGPQLRPLQLRAATGGVSLRRVGARTLVGVDDLRVTLDGMQMLGPVRAEAEVSDTGSVLDGRLELTDAEIGQLDLLRAALPVPAAWQNVLDQTRVAGRVDALALSWQDAPGDTDAWSVNARLTDLELMPVNALPGLSGFELQIAGDQSGGHFRIAGHEAVLQLPGVFEDPAIALAHFELPGNWRRDGVGLLLKWEGARVSNADLEGTTSGWYRTTGEGPGELDLDARLNRAEPTAVWRYLPLTVNQPTRDWVRRALKGGTVNAAQLEMRGDLRDFPYPQGQGGRFVVTTWFEDLDLDYGRGWPELKSLAGEIRFEGPGMFIKVDRARVRDVNIGPVLAEVADLNQVGGQVMQLEGQATGPTQDFLRFVADSPISTRIDGISNGMLAEGEGRLDLAFSMPLHHVDETTVKGAFRFEDNRLNLISGWPWLNDASAELEFSERTFAIVRSAASWLGAPLKATAQTRPEQGLVFDIQGGAGLENLATAVDLPLGQYLSGQTQWRAALVLGEAETRLSLRSELLGLSSTLPSPMNKMATEVWPLELDLRRMPAGGFSLSTRIEPLGVMRVSTVMQQGKHVLSSGGVAIGAPLEVGEGALRLVFRTDEVDVDEWRKVFEALGAQQSVEAEGEGTQRGWPIGSIAVTAETALLFGQRIDRLGLTAQALVPAVPGGWAGHVSSRQVEGTFDWRADGAGVLRGRFARLNVGVESAATEAGVDAAAAGLAHAVPGTSGAALLDDALPARLPALDLIADRFVLRGMELGRLSLNATNRDGVWNMSQLELINPDGRFSGDGHWVAGEAMLTELRFTLEAGDTGSMLDRLGYPGAVSGGRSKLSGEVAWRGAPTRLDHASLSGQMTVESERGQFSRLEPGVGRLLGVLSLQALPRRLNLDFRDVFSEGFAFDRISGSISMREGVLHTDDFNIVGPSARVWIQGTVDLLAETQELRVAVQPTLSESVAIGAAAGLINPVAGVVTFLAQKALSDPIERIFAFSYGVRGSWSDPIVERLVEPGEQPESSSR